MKCTFVFYFILFVKGSFTKSIQNSTVDNRFAALEKLVEKLEVRINKTEDSVQETNDHRTAVFYARLTSAKSLNTYSTIKFNSVIINEGGHYNANDGVFVAPVPGVYMFAWSTLTHSGNSAFTELRVESSSIGTLESSAASSQYTPASRSLVCHVKKGNHVWIQTNGQTTANYITDMYDSTSFMGFLLYKT